MNENVQIPNTAEEVNLNEVHAEMNQDGPGDEKMDINDVLGLYKKAQTHLFFKMHPGAVTTDKRESYYSKCGECGYMGQNRVARELSYRTKWIILIQCLTSICFVIPILNLLLKMALL